MLAKIKSIGLSTYVDSYIYLYIKQVWIFRKENQQEKKKLPITSSIGKQSLSESEN